MRTRTHAKLFDHQVFKGLVLNGDAELTEEPDRAYEIERIVSGRLLHKKHRSIKISRTRSAAPSLQFTIASTALFCGSIVKKNNPLSVVLD